MNTVKPAEGESNHAANWWRAVKDVRKERGGEALAGYFFIGPAVLLYIIFNAYPILRGIIIAFSDYRYLIPGYAPFNGIDNWKELAHDHVFWESLRRSLEYMGIYIGLNFVLCFLVALCITEIKSTREAGVYRAIAYLPVVLPIAVAVLVWKQLVNAQFGYIDVLVKNLFHLGHTPDLFHDARWSVPILAIITVWKAGGTSVLLMLVGLYSINTELYEAAALDGAGWWKRLYTITIPLLRPTFTLIFVLGAGVLGAVEESLVFFGVLDAGPEAAGRLVGRYAYETAFLQGDLRWGYAAAMNLTVAFISIVISIALFRILRSERTV